MRNYTLSGLLGGQELELVYVNGVSYVKPATPSYDKVQIPSTLLTPRSTDVSIDTELAELSFTRRMLSQWEDSFRDLHRFLTDDKTVSKRASEWGIVWMTFVFARAGELPPPEVVVSGDGGLDLEWTVNGRFICIHVGADDEEFESIYVDMNGKSAVTKLDPASMVETFTSF